RRLVAAACRDGLLRVIDCDAAALVVAFRSWFGAFLCVDWSADGRYIASGGEDDAVCLWRLDTRECVLRCEGHRSWVTSVAFDPWGGTGCAGGGGSNGVTPNPNYRLVSVAEDAQLCVWEHDEAAAALLRPQQLQREQEQQ
ncbi:unnamed protein product, partial [Phaeothamnion confervicola]